MFTDGSRCQTIVKPRERTATAFIPAKKKKRAERIHSPIHLPAPPKTAGKKDMLQGIVRTHVRMSESTLKLTIHTVGWSGQQ